MQAERVATGKPVLGASPAWNPLDLKAFVGVSGIYDLAALSEHLHRRGLSKWVPVEGRMVDWALAGASGIYGLAARAGHLTRRSQSKWVAAKGRVVGT